MEGDLLRQMLGEPVDDSPSSAPARPARRSPASLRTLPRARDELDLLHVRDPELSFADLLLPEDARQTFAELHLEHLREDLLVAHGVGPRRTLLLVGPPGTGKTATAEALADEMGRQIATVNLSTVVSSFLGDTAKNLQSIFDAASSERWIVLFDEFDAIGKERAEATDHGELKRVVTAFLQQLDRFRGPSVLVAATNHAGLLDLAAWRRFQIVLTYGSPSVHEIRALLRLKLRSVRKEAHFDIDRLAGASKGLSHAGVTQAVTDAYRHHILHHAGQPLAAGSVLLAIKAAQKRREAAATS
jgi:SpoVK/Ycf46/Vps4 family AAA+-type ATPase